MISDDELDALARHIATLEAEAARLSEANISLESQVAFLMKERLLYTEGPEALRKVAALALTDIPEGYGIGNNGQMIAVNTAQAQAEIHHHWPVDQSKFKPAKRKPGKPDGDGL